MNSLDAWIKANPYVSKLIVAVLTGVLGWFTHKYLGVDIPPVPVDKPAPTSKHVYGWKAASPELRAAVHAECETHAAAVADLPPAYAVPDTGPVLDQGQLGSCGPNAMDTLLYKAGSVWPCSRLFTYYETRKLMGTVRQDSGVINSQMVRAVKSTGWIDESQYPYNIRSFRLKPPAAVVSNASHNKGVKFAAVDVDVDHIKSALSQNRPVLVGIEVFESFESDAAGASGDIPMPTGGEQLLGGHDVAVTGWDDAAQRFTFKNSWGAGWGANGFGTLPYEYVTKYGSDFWAIVSLK